MGEESREARLRGYPVTLLRTAAWAILYPVLVLLALAVVSREESDYP